MIRNVLVRTGFFLTWEEKESALYLATAYRAGGSGNFYRYFRPPRMKLNLGYISTSEGEEYQSRLALQENSTVVPSVRRDPDQTQFK